MLYWEELSRSDATIPIRAENFRGEWLMAVFRSGSDVSLALVIERHSSVRKAERGMSRALVGARLRELRG